MKWQKLINRIKNDFLWYKTGRKLGNNSFNVFENMDALTKMEHLMSYVARKVNHLRGKRDLASLIFSAAAFATNLKNSYEIAIFACPFYSAQCNRL